MIADPRDHLEPVRQPAQAESKSEQAYAWIKARLESHQFGPGHRLVLASIAEVLDMSVVPVREAIRRLEAEGSVTFERNVGARVAVVDESEYVDTMQTLGLLEGAATALAAPLLTEEDLDQALATNDQMQRLLKQFDAYTFTLLNQQFHTVLFERCPNPQILEMVHRAWGRLAALRESTFKAIPARAEHSVTEHIEIVELIRSRAAPMEIELAARQHRYRTLQAYLDVRHPESARSAQSPLSPEPPDQPQPATEAP